MKGSSKPHANCSFVWIKNDRCVVDGTDNQTSERAARDAKTIARPLVHPRVGQCTPNLTRKITTMSTFSRIALCKKGWR